MSPGQIASIEELLAHARALEEEAAQRYAELADQLALHGNPEVAALFRRLAEIEAKHLDHVSGLVGDSTLPHIAPWDYQWPDAESPEAIAVTDVHYLMQPYHAITLALTHERRAVEFFEALAERCEDPAVRELARSLAAEEREHVGWLEQWLTRYPEPDAHWAEDPDPPVTQE